MFGVAALALNAYVGHRMIHRDDADGSIDGEQGDGPAFEGGLSSRAHFTDDKGELDLRSIRAPPKPPPPRKRAPVVFPKGWRGKKKPMPYDVDLVQPANWSVLSEVHLGPDFPLVMTQESMQHETFKRLDGMEYFTTCEVPREVIEEQAEEGEKGEEAEKPKKSAHLKMRKIVYRIPKFLYDALPKKEPRYDFEECAVVGNSGQLLNKDYGEQIDASDAVLRINNAPIAGFDKHVGTKTTFNLVNQAHAKAISAMHVRHLHNNASVLVYESGHAAVRLRIFPKLLAVMGRGHAQLLNPSFIVKGYSFWLSLKALVEEQKASSRLKHNNTAPVNFKRKPMSGFFATLLCMQFCKRIRLYGFSPWRPGLKKKGAGLWAPYHYFDMVPGSTAVHSFDLSIEVFKLLAQTADIQVLK
mmetsp:Transcript_28855/g.92128  ORF Transcript_28855/g.92128 Transcript_28855/m.92128 type:complete len:413 (+) Transcript_28855:166-1404(+)|eukprot:CAMPEP_0182907746 /NCGR_PEP_ID=MMETSP0034_2-20130328/34705_1 /TAXON_ID=156128 /ORGANISM="Nephroselmis pyriformis, Strain CCMP717" /LENGTH=412 /DNA_ID=CAMNT_0025043759 /DNA_START=119 /DNA_END=1357 /DNA_ORIENTATION=-